MSHPRQIVPGATYLVTRRTLRRYFLLRPDAEVNQILVYVLAVSAARFGVQVHALCAMSTHLHVVLTDVDGRLPNFLRVFHRLTALGIKALRKWEGPVWDPTATSAVRLLTDAAVVEKIAYVLANPVSAGLVWQPAAWPGAKTSVSDIGAQELRANRPPFYLDPKNPQWPERATLPISLPPMAAPRQRRDLLAKVSAQLKSQLADAHAALRREGRRLLGAERALSVSPEERATSAEDLHDRNPTFATGSRQGRSVRDAAVRALRTFRASYRVAREQWRVGIRDVLFPFGTWWMRVFHGASTEPRAPSG